MITLSWWDALLELALVALWAFLAGTQIGIKFGLRRAKSLRLLDEWRNEDK